MSKKSSFRGYFQKQYGKRAQTLLKSASQHLCLIHWSLGRNLFSRKSLLLTCQILGLLPNTLAADEKYPVLNRDNLTIPIQIQFSQKQKSFFKFFAAFFKCRWNSSYFKEKRWPSSILYFRSCGLRKRGQTNSKKSRFKRSFDKQHCKCAQALLKTTSQHLDHIHWSLPSQLSWKKSLLLTCQIFGLLVNTLAADEKYPVLNRDNITIPFQMLLSHKQKTFCEFFGKFFKSSWNFEHFEKKDDPHRFCNFEIVVS